MNIIDFLPQNVESGAAEKEVKLSRFKSPFVIQTITEAENAALRKSCTIKRFSKSGAKVSDLDQDKYTDKLVLRCIKFPNLEDSQLQEAYGTQGNPSETLKTMLLAGEYADLTQSILEFNGFDEAVEELAEDVKN